MLIAVLFVQEAVKVISALTKKTFDLIYEEDIALNSY